MNLTFDEAKHQYLIDGVPVVSVTQVIRDVLPGFQADPWYLERGRALHRATELHDLSTLDIATVDPTIKGRYVAWLTFLEHYPIKLIGIEKSLGSSIYQYAGTIDRVFADDGGAVICDIKSSYSRQSVVQLGGYGWLWQQEYKTRPITGVVVTLNDNGTYSAKWITEHEMRRASQEFLGCLTAYNVRRLCGIKEDTNACSVSERGRVDHSGLGRSDGNGEGHGD